MLPALLSLGCCACSEIAPAPTGPARRPPLVVADKILGGLDLQVEAENVSQGDRPRLYVDCSGTPSLSFDVLTAPSTIPPLAGVRSSIEIDRQTWTAEWSIADPKQSLWTLRDAKLSARLGRAVISAREVRVHPPAQYAPADTIIWKVDLAQSDRARLKKQCE